MNLQIASLTITITVETLILLLMFKNKKPVKDIIFAGVVVNMITNPMANLLYPSIGFIEIEIGVIIVETFLYSLALKIKIIEGFKTSLCTNIPTALLSFLI